MSNDVNTRLLEEASEIIDEGYINKYDLVTLEQAIADNDLDMIRYQIKKYRIWEREFDND